VQTFAHAPDTISGGKDNGIKSNSEEAGRTRSKEAGDSR